MTRSEIKQALRIYSELTPHSSYGVDDFLIMKGLVLEDIEGMTKLLSKVKQKESMVLRQRLKSSDITSSEVNAIKLLLERLEEETNNTSESISISLISNIEGRGDE